MKKILLFLLALSIGVSNYTYAQSRKITGKVTSADDGQPLPGVSVKIQGTNQGVLTDGDGVFSVNASTGQTLEFTYIGFTTQRVAVPTGNFPPIRLKSDTRMLTEVVVTNGYATQAKKAYTGAAATVSGAENENKPFSTPLQALQGEVAGLNISLNSGQPGANVPVRIRGTNSINLSSQPLFVIDGMIINSGDLSRVNTTSNVLAGINENDIESVTVLKDATATAIYGARAANGVIVINTKRGKAGKTSVRFDAEGGTTANLPIPDAGKPLTAAQYRELFTEGENNAAIDNPTSFTNPAQRIASYVGGPRSNDWYDLLTRKGRQQQYNVSLNGGSENTRVYASAGFFEQQATIIKSELKRYTGQLNVDQTISKRFSVSTNLNFSNVDQNSPANGGAFSNPVGNVYFLRPFQLAYNDDGSLNTSRSGVTNFPSSFNNLYLAQNDKKHLSQTRILGNTQLRWTIWDELKFTSYASVDYNTLEENRFDNPVMGDGRTAGGRGYDYYTRYFNWLVRNQLSYRYNVKGVEDFYIDASVGYEAQRSKGYFINAQSNLFPNQPALTVSAVAATPIAGNATFDRYAYNGLFATAAINFQNRYSLSGSFRRDGSSVFGENNRYGNFYSVGGAWNIDQEDFFKVQNVLSSAKLRASAGSVGNASGLGSYAARPTAGYGTAQNYAGANGQNFNTIGNVDLTWESQKKYDVGMDFGFFKDRFTFIVDLYQNEIDGLILNAPLSRTTGFSTITQNVGEMRNRGIEFTVKGAVIKTQDFNWTTNFNVSHNANTVLKLVNKQPIISSPFRYIEGRDLNSYYARIYAGVNPANGEALWYTDGSRTATTNNYAAAQRVDGKQSDPKIFGGFNNTFTYKGVVLTTDFYYNFGNMVNDASWGYYLKDGTAFDNNKYYYTYANRWTTPGQITDVPRYTHNGMNAGQSSNFSTRDLYYGDFIRLKNLVVGYEFKNLAAIKKLGLSRLYLYGRGTNLWTKTYDKRLPFDPERGPNGTNNLDVYQVKTFTVGINVGL